VGRIVLGWPRRTDGRRGTAEGDVEALAAEIRARSGLPVELWDERLTSVLAERLLVHEGVPRAARRQLRDQVAAELILQSYLDAHRQASGGDEDDRTEERERMDRRMTHDHEHSLEDEIITLTDEDGQEHQFAILDVIEVDNKEYAILIPTDEAEAENEDEAVILRLETDESGEEVLVDIEDDEEWQRVAQVWEELVESEDDEEEDEEDEDED